MSLRKGGGGVIFCPFLSADRMQATPLLCRERRCVRWKTAGRVRGGTERQVQIHSSQLVDLLPLTRAHTQTHPQASGSKRKGGFSCAWWPVLNRQRRRSLCSLQPVLPESREDNHGGIQPCVKSKVVYLHTHNLYSYNLSLSLSLSLSNTHTLHTHTHTHYTHTTHTQICMHTHLHTNTSHLKLHTKKKIQIGQI